MPTLVNISDAKAQLSALVARVEAGETVLIGKAGRPVAVLSSYDESTEPRALGAWAGRVRAAPDFDDPLPPALQRGFEGS